MKSKTFFIERPQATVLTDDLRQEVAVGPPFSSSVQRQVNSLYKSIFCLASRFQKTGDGEIIYAWLAYSESGLKAAIFFSEKGGRINVLNEYFEMPGEFLEKFIDFVFSRYSCAETISCPSIRVAQLDVRFLLQRYRSTEDIVIMLPDTVEQYDRSLGRSTRDNLKRYQKRIFKNIQGIKFVCFNNAEVDEALIQIIVDLNRARMDSKGQLCRHTEKSRADLNRIVAAYGFVVIGEHNGRVCCGVICTIVDSHVYMHVVAHDPYYDSFRLGMVCCYLSVCGAIQRGAKSYHMLSGEYDYKFRLGGEKLDFDRITIYRSHFCVINNFGTYVGNVIRGNGRRIKMAIRDWRVHKGEKDDINSRRSSN